MNFYIDQTIKTLIYINMLLLHATNGVLYKSNYPVGRIKDVIFFVVVSSVQQNGNMIATIITTGIERWHCPITI